MKNKKRADKDSDGAGALFIPGGILIGMGFGFLYGNFPAGMFIGLGVGFVAFAITSLVQKKRK